MGMHRTVHATRTSYLHALRFRTHLCMQIARLCMDVVVLLHAHLNINNSYCDYEHMCVHVCICMRASNHVQCIAQRVAVACPMTCCT